MKQTKKILSLFLALFLMIGISACTQNGKDDTKGADNLFKAGTYVEKVDGHNGEVEVETVFSKDRIDSVKILSHEESPTISDLAIERVPKTS